jgi:hypothetical protein
MQKAKYPPRPEKVHPPQIVKVGPGGTKPVIRVMGDGDISGSVLVMSRI